MTETISREATGPVFSLPAMAHARAQSMAAVRRIAEAIQPGMTQAQADILAKQTLQDKSVQLANFGRELLGRADALPGYQETLVEITDPAVVATSGKTHHPIVQASAHPSHEVAGTVFEITASELASADSYEVSDYKRVRVRLKSGLQAWVYVQS